MKITVNGERPKPAVLNMADFKRFLAEPGATVKGLYHWRQADMAELYKVSFFAPRTVMSLHTNGVYWSTGAWLAFGKAKDWLFGCDQGRPIAQWIRDNGEVGFTFELSYAED